MKLLINALQLLINRYILRKSVGTCVKIFAERMGIVYIKMAQILAMQNIGNIFTEKDRTSLLHICDGCNPVEFKNIEDILCAEYDRYLYSIFAHICPEPVGSASVSQVHKAHLSTGECVAIKVKRRDISKTIYHDIKVVRFIINHFGKLFGLTNLIGGEHALQFYLKWIMEEVDFGHELQNIMLYTKFASEVNGGVEGTVNIVVPKVYEELCTENVIVMEYIEHPTVSNMGTDDATTNRILRGFNDYIRLSFYALFNGKTVVWHGDPHAGNVYIDDKGNIGFLDMGLLFVLSLQDADMTKEFFFSAYFGKYEKLYYMLLPYLEGNQEVRNAFKERCKLYCQQIRHKPITNYFMDMVWVCAEFSIKPPDFLFGMAKAFVCLGGVDTVYHNSLIGIELVKEQVTEFLVSNAVSNGIEACKQLCVCQKGILTGNKHTVVKGISGVINCFNETIKYVT